MAWHLLIYELFTVVYLHNFELLFHKENVSADNSNLYNSPLFILQLQHGDEGQLSAAYAAEMQKLPKVR